jgi:hypothetical protein
MSRYFSNLRLKSCFVFFVLLFAIFTANAAPESAVPSSSANSPIPSAGKVLSVEYGGGYSFIEVQLASSDNIFVATASLPNDINVGSMITWESPQLAKDYYSHALQRTFPLLYMVTFKQQHIDKGVIESVQTIGDNTYLGVSHNQKQLMLIVNKNQNSSKLLQGALVEWQLASSQPHKLNTNMPTDSPLVVEWVRIVSASN